MQTLLLKVRNVSHNIENQISYFIHLKINHRFLNWETKQKQNHYKLLFFLMLMPPLLLSVSIAYEINHWDSFSSDGLPYPFSASHFLRTAIPKAQEMLSSQDSILPSWTQPSIHLHQQTILLSRESTNSDYLTFVFLLQVLIFFSYLKMQPYKVWDIGSKNSFM